MSRRQHVCGKTTSVSIDRGRVNWLEGGSPDRKTPAYQSKPERRGFSFHHRSFHDRGKRNEEPACTIVITIIAVNTAQQTAQYLAPSIVKVAQKTPEINLSAKRTANPSTHPPGRARVAGLWAWPRPASTTSPGRRQSQTSGSSSQHDMTRHDTTWHDMTWHDMTWHAKKEGKDSDDEARRGEARRGEARRGERRITTKIQGGETKDSLAFQPSKRHTLKLKLKLKLKLPRSPLFLAPTDTSITSILLVAGIGTVRCCSLSLLSYLDRDRDRDRDLEFDLDLDLEGDRERRLFRGGLGFSSRLALHLGSSWWKQSARCIHRRNCLERRFHDRSWSPFCSNAINGFHALDTTEIEACFEQNPQPTPQRWQRR